MTESEGILQILDNLGFSLQFGRAVGFRLDVFRVEGLAHQWAEEKMVCEADVLHLFGERAHAFELAVGRREGIFVFGHGLRSGNDLLLDSAVNPVENGRDGGRLLGRLASLGADGWSRGGGGEQDERYGKVLHSGSPCSCSS